MDVLSLLGLALLPFFPLPFIFKESRTQTHILIIANNQWVNILMTFSLCVGLKGKETLFDLILKYFSTHSVIYKWKETAGRRVTQNKEIHNKVLFFFCCCGCKKKLWKCLCARADSRSPDQRRLVFDRSWTPTETRTAPNECVPLTWNIPVINNLAAALVLQCE